MVILQFCFLMNKLRQYTLLAEIVSVIESSSELLAMMEAGRLSFHVQDKLYPYYIDGRYYSFHDMPSCGKSLRYVCLVHGEIHVLGYRSMRRLRGYLCCDGRYLDLTDYMDILPF